jgi:hypothetical protein
MHARVIRHYEFGEPSFLGNSHLASLGFCLPTATASRGRREFAHTLSPEVCGRLSFFQEDYRAAYFDLNGDGIKEVIVYLTHYNWCGSGGCITLILEPTKSSFTVITKMTIVRPPIRVLDTSSHGWRNLTVWVQGGGIQPGYEAELRFDGKKYPSNPSMPPAVPLTGKATGQVILPQ